MKRLRLKLLSKCLLLGAALNWPIAWLCVWISPHTEWKPIAPPAAQRPDGWLWAPPGPWPIAREPSDAYTRLGQSFTQKSQATVSDGFFSGYVEMWDIRRGWPLHSLASKVAVQRDASTNHVKVLTSPSLLDRGIPLTSQQHPPANLPLRPLARPFIINTLLYSAVICAASTLTRHLRHKARRRRSRCTHCCYNVTDLPTCPECGTPVHSIPNSAALSGPPR